MKKACFTNVELKTPRLVLRGWKSSDWKAVQTYARSPRVYRYMPWGPNTPSQTKSFIRDAIVSRNNRPRITFEFAVLHPVDDLVIGGCGLRIKNLESGEADMGYCLRADYWGRGYATEIAQTLRDFGFNKLKMRRIWATCDVLNRRSEKVMRKIGMKREGLLREHMLIRGRFRSSYLYAMLSTDRRPL